jgi:4'-phosphopantetheinyl transferase
VIPVRWLLAEIGDVPEGDGWLSPAERQHLQTLRLPWRRADWRLGRWTAKRAVGLYLDTAGRVEIHPAPDGAPEAFLDGAAAPVAISLTHRAGRAVCAVAPAGTRLGCDLEIVEPRSEAFLADYFTPAERSYAEQDRPLLANLTWSAKESALKALREGLRMDTRSVEVSFQEGEDGGWSPFTAVCAGLGQTFQGWWRRDGDLLLTLATAPAPAVPRALVPVAQV